MIVTLVICGHCKSKHSTASKKLTGKREDHVFFMSENYGKSRVKMKKIAHFSNLSNIKIAVYF